MEDPAFTFAAGQLVHDDGVRPNLANCDAGPSIVFTNPRGQKVDDVYVRFGNSTRKLTPAEMLQYMSEWGSGASGQSDASSGPSSESAGEETEELEPA